MNALHLGDAKNEQKMNLGYKILSFFNTHTTFEIDPPLVQDCFVTKVPQDDMFTKALEATQ
ncbi:hypothetical protein DHC50_01490 [Arenibacter sp. A80]|jgi:hypothetical protein|nr:hypothetical protein [Arenibacter sp. A80]RFT57865.1 hypothetical protein D0S24_01490 [Arenibacter sp. P308M17]